MSKKKCLDRIFRDNSYLLNEKLKQVETILKELAEKKHEHEHKKYVEEGRYSLNIQQKQ